MADYQSGRLEEAAKGFARVVSEEPANASARFQLACLLHDFRRDFLGATVAYSEFLSQQPGSDKAPLAKSRLAACEKELAKELARKYGLNSGEKLAQELERAREELKRSAERETMLSSDSEAAFRRIAALQRELKRLKQLIRDATPEESAAPAGTAEMKDAKALLDAAADETPGRAASAEEIAALKAEEKDELSESASSILPVQPKSAKEERDARKAAADAAAPDDKQPKRPSSYVVQDGDTLYKIAIKFYGTSSAWSRIRDANKAKISMDGRVRKGQTIVLPDK